MENYAIVESGVVTDMFLWDGNTENFTPPSGAIKVPDGTVAGIGYAYANGVFTAPAVVTINPPATPALIAAAALAAGLTIASTSTPAINGTYPIDAQTQIAIGQIETFIMKNGVFPGSEGTSLARYDTSNVPHVFPSIDLFTAFATAIANYVVDLSLYAAGAPGAALPAASVTIA